MTKFIEHECARLIFGVNLDINFWMLIKKNTELNYVSTIKLSVASKIEDRLILISQSRIIKRWYEEVAKRYSHHMLTCND